VQTPALAPVPSRNISQSPQGGPHRSDTEIANAYVYLMSEDARQVTGQLLTVDAGATAAPNPARSHHGPSEFLGPPGLVARFAS
jgi:hypothetical protein